MNYTSRCILLSISLVSGCAKSADEAHREAAPNRSGAVNIYAGTTASALSLSASKDLPRVYVPNSKGNTVSVIDPATYSVVRTFPTGNLPQHVVPSYDLSTLWVANDMGNSLTRIDPLTGRDSNRVAVDDPYNLYFTPDGKFALVIAERLNRIDFRDPQSMKLVQSVHVGCRGIDHLEFTLDGRFAIATCEFSGELVKISLPRRAVVGYLALAPNAGFWHPLVQRVSHLFRKRKTHAIEFNAASMPQDIRSSPDGRTFYVADMRAGGVVLIDPLAFRRIGFVPTGIGTHGLYPSRNATQLYVTNRGWRTPSGGRHGPGSISVLDFATNKIVATWPIPGGGSPDMGNVSADGKELWVSGRYDNEVYVFNTSTGKLTHRIPVGREPHGLTVWPQPGSHSLGHTGNMR